MTKASCDGSKSDCNKAIKEILRLESRWFDLKNWVVDTGIPLKDSPSKDYQVGHNDALEGILHYMKTLEENDIHD